MHISLSIAVTARLNRAYSCHGMVVFIIRHIVYFALKNTVCLQGISIPSLNADKNALFLDSQAILFISLDLIISRLATML